MGSQGVTGRETSEPDSSRMVVKSGGNWKRPVNRMYTYNFQIGENYYLPMTSYLETKTGAPSDVPGPLCFSERISLHPQSGTSPSRPSRRRDKSSLTCNKTSQHSTSRFSISTTSSRALQVDCGEGNVEAGEADDDDLRAVRNVMA